MLDGSYFISKNLVNECQIYMLLLTIKRSFHLIKIARIYFYTLATIWTASNILDFYRSPFWYWFSLLIFSSLNRRLCIFNTGALSDVYLFILVFPRVSKPVICQTFYYFSHELGRFNTGKTRLIFISYFFIFF